MVRLGFARKRVLRANLLIFWKGRPGTKSEGEKRGGGGMRGHKFKRGR